MKSKNNNGQKEKFKVDYRNLGNERKTFRANRFEFTFLDSCVTPFATVQSTFCDGLIDLVAKNWPHYKDFSQQVEGVMLEKGRYGYDEDYSFTTFDMPLNGQFKELPVKKDSKGLVHVRLWYLKNNRNEKDPTPGFNSDVRNTLEILTSNSEYNKCLVDYALGKY